VNFNDDANLTVGMTDVEQAEGVTTVNTAIDGLSASNGTWIDKGIALAKNQFTTDTVRNPDRIVVVFTDGVPGNGSWRLF
jgi:Mg-chelatase subunit ChlD